MQKVICVAIFSLACVNSARAQLPTLISTTPRSAPTPAPAAGISQGEFSSNTTNSLGYLCSSSNGILTALQRIASNQNSAGLQVSLTGYTDPTSLSQIATIAWHYIVTYPLPYLAKTLAGVSVNATKINTFSSSSQTLSNYTTTTIAGGVTPNTDTLYNQAFLDLSQGPQVVTVPQFDNPKRYWIVPFLDAYLNFYGALGSAYNTTAGSYLVVGPNVPRNQTFGNFTSNQIFYSPTNINWVIGRVLVLNSTDIPTAYSFSQQYNITPYEAAGPAPFNASSRAALISASVNGSGYGSYFNSLGFLQGFSQQASQWFNVSAQYLSIDPPVNGSTATLISNLQSLVRNSTNAASNGLFSLGNQVARQCILAGNTGLTTTTGWTYHTTSGVYTTASGTDYLQRAQDTQYIPAALPAQQVIYYLSTSFYSTTPPLDASTGRNYTISIPLPVPAGSFWSLIIYNATNLGLFQNPINRYEIGDRTTGLIYSGINNNTVNVFISASAPPIGTSQYANWLPAPTDAPFEFILRTYIPPASSIAGQYIPPAVTLLSPSTAYTPTAAVAAAG